MFYARKINPSRKYARHITLKCPRRSNRALVMWGRLGTRFPISLAFFRRKRAIITLLTIDKCDFFDMSSLYSEKEIIVLADCPNTHLQYVVQQREQGNEVVFWLKIKQEVLARWRKEK